MAKVPSRSDRKKKDVEVPVDIRGSGSEDIVDKDIGDEAKDIGTSDSESVAKGSGFLKRCNVSSERAKGIGPVEEDKGRDKGRKKSFFGRFLKKGRIHIGEARPAEVKEGSCDVSEKVTTKTKVDEIMEMVDRKEKVKVEEISKRVGIERQRIEEWVKILEEHGLVSIHYTLLGSMEVRRPETKKRKVDKNENDE